MSDYYATLKIQNGRLKKAMEDAGIKSINQLSKACGSHPTQIGRIFNFKESPKKKNGEWRICVQKLCALVNCDPTDIFPDEMIQVMPTNKIGSYIEQAQLSGMRERQQLNPHEHIENMDKREALIAIIDTLTPREAEIIKARFWDDRTLADIASDHNVTRERIRQIEDKALNKLRHPQRADRIKEAIS